MEYNHFLSNHHSWWIHRGYHEYWWDCWCNGFLWKFHRVLWVVVCTQSPPLHPARHQGPWYSWFATLCATDKGGCWRETIQLIRSDHSLITWNQSIIACLCFAVLQAVQLPAYMCVFRKESHLHSLSGVSFPLAEICVYLKWSNIIF